MGASNLPDSCKEVRDAKCRESEWKKSLEKRRVLRWERKNGRAIGNAPQQEGGQSRKRFMPLHMAEVRSDNRGPEGAADERARKPGSTAGEGGHRTKPLVPEAGPGGTDCAVELLAQEAETSLTLGRPRATKVTP